MNTETALSVFQVDHPADLAFIQISVKEMTSAVGFHSIEQTLIAAAASELATNILHYAGAGTLTIEKIEKAGRSGIRIKAEDTGPGIEDISRAMDEDYSTGSSLGLGLPSVKRIMDSFQIISEPGKGTCVTVEKWRVLR